MSNLLDQTDRQILKLLQEDATLSIDSLANTVHLSRNACWRRVKRLEETGAIRARVALVDAAMLGKGQLVFILMRAADHTPEWLKAFERAVHVLPEITGAHRMSGDLDYVLRVQVADVADYDRFYKKLISMVPVRDISASFVMENIKDSTVVSV
ncbi:Lrp/AsnC family transcriptional regulator [uncultured Litoreibacter sp.]|uniref:Lrp/AsnC family transcriptional regulator n=1 Tax=uncultured Litoreibacter sp. TaxID=1392394 RepID=UPI00262BFCB0|nr:Lrp/AsnC family transcriptional regulator [uncultured Litoreibacter sp.]